MTDNIERLDTDFWKNKYHDLIMQVGKKYPGESRHDTAKRYILEAEKQDHGPAKEETDIVYDDGFMGTCDPSD